MSNRKNEQNMLLFHKKMNVQYDVRAAFWLLFFYIDGNNCKIMDLFGKKEVVSLWIKCTIYFTGIKWKSKALKNR